MTTDAAGELHRSLYIAGFRALATAAGLLQLCRELKAAGLLPAAAIDRIRQAMFDELMEQAPRSLTGTAEFAARSHTRLEQLFAGTAKVDDPSVMTPTDPKPRSGE